MTNLDLYDNDNNTTLKAAFENDRPIDASRNKITRIER